MFVSDNLSYLSDFVQFKTLTDQNLLQEYDKHYLNLLRKFDFSDLLESGQLQF